MTDKLLSKQRKAWAERFKVKAIKGTPLNYNAALQVRYTVAIDRLVMNMMRAWEKELTAFFKTSTAKQYYAADGVDTMDDSIASQARILTNDLMSRFDQLFGEQAPLLSETMLNQADKASATATSASMEQLSGGLTIKTTAVTGEMREIVKASVTENVGLIKSISQKYATDMQGAVMRSITTGNGLQDLVPYFKKYRGVTLRRARLIASDQTKKAYANLNAARMEKLGVDKYEWIHSGGGAEPRDLHRSYNGKIFSLSDPPVIQYAKGSLPEVYGKPGDLINCRCTMRPVIDFDQL